jgi:bifunctional non-homologous end joining protein LigD
VVFEAFDLLAHNGEDLRMLELRERKKRLQRVLKCSAKQIQYATDISGDGQEIFRKACEAGAEGIIAKKADAHYQSGRQTSWVKVKGDSRADVYIVGWRPSDSRPFASLLVATDRSGRLRFAGGVGTGFSIAEKRHIEGARTALTEIAAARTRGR